MDCVASYFHSFLFFSIKKMASPIVQDKTKETMEVEKEQVSYINMESVSRVAKLPVVEAAINTATNLYGKAKDSNSMINYALSTAESTVKTGVEKISPLAQPIAASLEGPIKKVDGMLCSGLDYVETKVPCVKLPPGEMYENTKNYINDTVQPAVQSAQHFAAPAVETARNIVEPAVETARHIVEPMVQSAVAAKDYGLEKVEELVKGKKPDATTDGRPRRVRPALLPSSTLSLVTMFITLEEMMQHQEDEHMQNHRQSGVCHCMHACVLWFAVIFKQNAKKNQTLLIFTNFIFFRSFISCFYS